MKVAVALSGGVDSSAALVLALRKYSDVIAVTMRTFDNAKYGFEENEGPDKAIEDAAKVCRKLNVRHHITDVSSEFEKYVVSDFIEKYSSGETPNPCTLCNPTIKWGTLLDKIKSLGAEKIITGHYAEIKNINGKYRIFRGKDTRRDQTYMLWGLSPEQLSFTSFPLALMNKSDIRKIAEEAGLHIASKGDSQDICFIKDNYENFLRNKTEIKPGNIIFTDGKIIGKHRGLPFYTVGQRKGLGLGWSSPLYVMNLDTEKNNLIVTDDKDKLKKHFFYINKVNWLTGEAPKIDKLSVKIRYKSTSSPVKSLRFFPDKMRVDLAEPATSVAKGQSAVFYREDELLGGGIIL
ncbi:MAG: tRNA 2-thiouridine(34) synthase MnmA [Candidatus Cloacimonadota bacterium]|nr:MAG: tRNA 2-thiouridine(34) synthase MnmA [Candidatus Cloacimonadota bacterium]